MEDAPDGDLTPIRVPASLTIALVLTVGRHARLRRVPGRGRPLHRLREPGHPRPLTVARPDRPTWRRPSTTRSRPGSAVTARSCARRWSTWRCTTPTTASTAPGGWRRAGAATSSPAPRSGRCSARCWPGPSTSWWDELGRPDPFTVVEAGAGRGMLARTVLLAEPRCAPALTYVLVERSPALRAAPRRAPPGDRPALAFPPGPATTTTTSRPSTTGPAPAHAWSRWPSCRRIAVVGRGPGQRAARQPALRAARAGATGLDEVRLGLDRRRTARWSRCWCPPATPTAALAERLAPDARPVPGSPAAGGARSGSDEALAPRRPGPAWW